MANNGLLDNTKTSDADHEEKGLDQSDAALNKYKPWGMTGIVFMDHEFHISEIALGVFLVFAGICFILAIIKAGIPAWFYAGALAVTSLVSLIFLWNYASVGTLAKLAARYARAAELYEALSKDLEEENKKMGEENAKFEKSNGELSASVKGLWKDVGVVDTAAADIEKILKGFESLTATAQLMEKYEQELNVDQAAFLRFQRQQLLNHKKAAIKRNLRDAFDDADVDQSGTITGKESGYLTRILKKELPSVPNATKAFDADGDGILKKWELMDAMDKMLDNVMTVEYEDKNGAFDIKKAH